MCLVDSLKYQMLGVCFQGIAGVGGFQILAANEKSSRFSVHSLRYMPVLEFPVPALVPPKSKIRSPGGQVVA